MALIFNGIAQGNLFQALDQDKGPRRDVSHEAECQCGLCLQIKSKEDLKKCWDKYIEPRVAQLSPELRYPQVLPIRVRQLLLNLSRYSSYNLVEDAFGHPLVTQKNLFIAVNKWLKEDQEQVKVMRNDKLILPWNLLQVIKILFEGQARMRIAVSQLQ